MILGSRRDGPKSISTFNFDIFVTPRRSLLIIPVLYFANKISNLLLEFSLQRRAVVFITGLILRQSAWR